MRKDVIYVNGESRSSGYEILIAHYDCGAWAKECLFWEKFNPYYYQTGYRLKKDYPPNKLALVSNKTVFDLYGERVKYSLAAEGFEVFVWLMEDGEEHKNLSSLESALKFFSEKGLKRTDAVVALGGGVVGDLAGFAAAIYLRGIDFLSIPTTLLAMIDASVGGKTAVNSEFGKNLIGTFHHPKGVLIDVEVLRTLPRRELTAGFCEAIKQGTVANKTLFNKTANFLKKYSPDAFRRYFQDKKFWLELENLIAAQVAFKAEVVMRDQRERVGRTDGKSRKILNFGHTTAHALEKVTGYKRFKHGEAVGYGMLVAGQIANNIGIFDKNELKSLNDVIGLVGKLPAAGNIEIKELIEAFEFDKKSLDKKLQWILLKKIGKPVIVDSETIPKKILLKSLDKVLKNK